MEHTDSLLQLYRAESGRLRQMVRRMTRRDSIAEDLVHDAFLRLLQQPEGMVREPPAWLMRVLRNLALNQIRQDGRSVVLPAAEGILENAVSEGPAVDTRLIAAESLRQCLRAIMALPPRRRQIFVLHRFHDLTYDEIAARLGISRNTVMVQIVNALADLHRDLGPAFFRRE